MTDRGKRITGLEGRFDVVEERVDGLETAPTERRLVPSVPRPTPRSQPAAPPSARESDSKAEIDATFLGMAQYLEGLRKAQERADRAQNAGLVMIARELGIEHKLPDELRRSVPPPTVHAPPPLRAIADQSFEAAQAGAALKRRSTRQIVIELVIALVTVITLLERIIHIIGEN